MTFNIGKQTANKIINLSGEITIGEQVEKPADGKDMTGTNCKYKKRLAEVEDESANMIRSLQQQVNTLSSELDRYKSYVNKTNYDSEKVAIGAVYKDIENGKLREQVNTLTLALEQAAERFADFNRNWDCDKDAHKYDAPCRVCEAAEEWDSIQTALQSIKESPREEQTP